MKFFIIACLLSVLPSLSNSQHTTGSTRDTVIIIPLDKSVISGEAIKTKVKNISAGMFHCTIVEENGAVHTWVDPSASYAVEAPQIPDPVLSVATGDIHSTIHYKDNSINQFFVTSQLSMFYPHMLTNVVEIASGPKMSAALTKKGILYTWGTGKTVKRLMIPVKTYGVKTASVGKEHIAFINIKDKVFVWGDHTKGQNRIPAFSAKPVKIVSGDYHTMVLDESGKVYVWGNNGRGQCNLPEFNVAVKEIAAKNFRSMAVTKNEQVVIWGMNEKVEVDFSKLGKVKKATLGYDFAVVVVEADAALIAQLQNKDASMHKVDLNPVKQIDAIAASIKDSVGDYANKISASNFLQEAAEMNFDHAFGKNNSLNIESHNSTIAQENSGDVVQFEGEGNKVNVVNENVHVKAVNSNRRVIIKGSNKTATLHNKNIAGTIYDDNKDVIIDLDQIGTDYEYPQEYNDLHDPETTVDVALIDFDSLPSSYITEWFIEDGNYVSLNGEILGKVNEYSKIVENAEFLANPFERAQANFYCKQYNKGIEILKEGAKDPYYYECSLALFDIYYYGLFGVSPNLPLAKAHYMNYLKDWARR